MAETDGEAVNEPDKLFLFGLVIIIVLFLNLLWEWRRGDNMRRRFLESAALCGRLMQSVDAEHQANLLLVAKAARYDEIRRRLRLRKKERGF